MLTCRLVSVQVCTSGRWGGGGGGNHRAFLIWPRSPGESGGVSVKKPTQVLQVMAAHVPSSHVPLKLTEGEDENEQFSVLQLNVLLLTVLTLA